ncbi:hypothetical protein V3I01_12620 [Sphingomonas sp. gentR]|jgi:hypothetical protein|uniref:hypothetical protein n=1 Tax=unclassified Sphingomonas TaxID=196159 RepID=UPI000972C797|nr:hypothetical protein [Sphingomonas sp. LK11]APX66949.1 hypothetical protein AV944_15170 [Sphingomonas sp. LK11]
MFGWMAAAMLLQVAQPVGDTADIIVRGQRADRALANCLKRGCNVPDDVRLTMALAEAQFGQGQYRIARATLAQGIERTKAETAVYPRQISALYEATATINRHIGDMEGYRSAVIGQTRLLRENVDENDLQRRMLPLTLGDSWMDRGQWRQALTLYSDAQRQYVRAGDARLASLAGLRRVSVMLARDDVAGARRALSEISEASVSQDSVVAPIRAVLAARIAKASGHDGEVDRLVETLRTDVSQPPIVAQEAPLKDDARNAPDETRRMADLSVNRSGAGGGEPIQWVDVSYMVQPDGRVTDAEILRGNGDRGWAAPYVAQIASRRYLPITLTDGRPGLYRLERLTRRARLIVPTGSFIKQAVGQVSVERQDLTRYDVASK